MVGLSLRPGGPSEGPTQPLVFWSNGTAFIFTDTATTGESQAPRPDRSHPPNELSLNQFTLSCLGKQKFV